MTVLNVQSEAKARENRRRNWKGSKSKERDRKDPGGSKCARWCSLEENPNLNTGWISWVPCPLSRFSGSLCQPKVYPKWGIGPRQLPSGSWNWLLETHCHCLSFISCCGKKIHGWQEQLKGGRTYLACDSRLQSVAVRKARLRQGLAAGIPKTFTVGSREQWFRHSGMPVLNSSLHS